MLFYPSKIFVALSLSSLILARGTVGSIEALQITTSHGDIIATTETPVEPTDTTPEPTSTTIASTPKEAKTETIGTGTVTAVATPTPEPTPTPTEAPVEQTTIVVNNTNNSSSHTTNNSNNNTTYVPPAPTPDNSGYQEVDNGSDVDNSEVNNNATQYIPEQTYSETFSSFESCNAKALSLAASGHTNNGCVASDGGYTVTWK